MHGLITHQGKKKCLGGDRPKEPRIDHYFLRERSANARGNERQEIIHSPQTPEPQEAEPSADIPDNTDVVSDRPNHAPEKKMEGLRRKVKWPKSCSRSEWATIEIDLVAKLESLKGTAESKLERIGEVIYAYGEEMFGVVEPRTRAADEVELSRRQREIRRLVKEKRQLSRQWKKASEEEKAGIDVLQAEIRERLSSLRRAENHRNQRRKREKTRASFFRGPFRFLKGLFTQERSGTLKVGKEQLEEYLRKTYTDENRFEHREIPRDMPPLPEPGHSCETFPPKLSEVERAVKRARAGSARDQMEYRI